MVPFGPATNFAVGGSAPFSIAVGDFDDDLDLDIATVNQASNNVSILLGNGNGTFDPATNFAVGSAPLFVAVGEFNGDGILDLAVANFNSANVSILLGDGDGKFDPATNFAVGSGPASIAVGDFN